MNEMKIEKLERHKMMAVRVVKKRGRANNWLLRRIAELMRDNDIEELEVYYGEEAVKCSFKGAHDDPAPAEAEAGIQERVEAEPVDGVDVGVQPSEGELPPKPKKRRRKKKAKGKSLLDDGKGV